MQASTNSMFSRPPRRAYVRKSGGQVIANKGATFYAVSASVCALCGILAASDESMATVSSMMHGEYGIDDVCISTLTLVGPKGIQGKVPVKLTEEEIAQLKASADALKAVIAQIDFCFVHSIKLFTFELVIVILDRSIIIE